MLTIEKLRAYGANVDEGMGRCMNNEAFYLRLVNMAADDGGFEKLRAAMESGDRKESFEAAHALKGMLGNLSLTPVSRPASELTELPLTLIIPVAVCFIAIFGIGIFNVKIVDVLMLTLKGVGL